MAVSSGMLYFIRFCFIFAFHDFKYSGDGEMLYFVNFCFVLFFHSVTLNTVVVGKGKLY